MTGGGGKTYRFSLDQICRDTTHRYDEDCDGVIVILVKGPQDETGDLENVEGVKHLHAIG